MYIATGNNYSVPQSVLDCVAAAGSDPVAKAACLPADDHFDSIMALDLQDGRDPLGDACDSVRRVDGGLHPVLRRRRPLPRTGRSRLRLRAGARAVHGEGRQRQARRTGRRRAEERPVLGARPRHRRSRWVTQTGPGGTAGGLQWGSAVDGTRVYTANANSNADPVDAAGRHGNHQRCLERARRRDRRDALAGPTPAPARRRLRARSPPPTASSSVARSTR